LTESVNADPLTFVLVSLAEIPRAGSDGLPGPA
jgi:hypothetical protein